MNKLYKIIKIVITILLVIVVAINLYTIFSAKVLKKDLVSVFGYSNLKIISGSMQPKINIGDLIIIKKSDTYEVGDIVTFKDDGTFVTHRIIDIEQNEITTKGDYNNKKDNDTITKDDIVGKVVLIIPALGSISNFLGKPSVLIIIFIVGIVVVTLMPSKSDKKTKVEKNI